MRYCRRGVEARAVLVVGAMNTQYHTFITMRVSCGLVEFHNSLERVQLTSVDVFMGAAGALNGVQTSSMGVNRAPWGLYGTSVELKSVEIFHRRLANIFMDVPMKSTMKVDGHIHPSIDMSMGLHGPFHGSCHERSRSSW